jgi:hypothetical protein
MSTNTYGDNDIHSVLIKEKYADPKHWMIGTSAFDGHSSCSGFGSDMKLEMRHELDQPETINVEALWEIAEEPPFSIDELLLLTMEPHRHVIVLSEDGHRPWDEVFHKMGPHYARVGLMRGMGGFVQFDNGSQIVCCSPSETNDYHLHGMDPSWVFLTPGTKNAPIQVKAAIISSQPRIGILDA